MGREVSAGSSGALLDHRSQVSVTEPPLLTEAMICEKAQSVVIRPMGLPQLSRHERTNGRLEQLVSLGSTYRKPRRGHDNAFQHAARNASNAACHRDTAHTLGPID